MSSLFGASPAQQAGGTTGTFSFGNNNTSSSSQPPPQQQQQQQQQPCASGGFSFGQTPAMQQPSQQTQPANAFGFGQPSQQNNSATAGGSGGLFGANTGKQLQEASTPASSFGSGGLFAASTAEQPKPAFPFGFVPSGQQIQQPQQTSLGQSQFGQSQPQFGQSQLGGSQMGASSSQSQPQHDKKLGTSLSAKLEQVRQAWDTSNLHTCNFLTYFYNNIPAGVLPPAGPTGASGGGVFEVNPNFGRRQDAVGPLHDALWEKAVRENPDRMKLVPVLAVGYSDLKSRVEAQEAEVTRQSEHLKRIMERVSFLEQKHNLSDSVRASAAIKRQAALHHRVMGIARKSHILVPVLKGSSITKEEEALRAKLEACEAELESAGAVATFGGSDQSVALYGRESTSTGRLRARVNELWVALGAVKAKREMLEREGRKAGIEWAVVDERGLEEVASILAQQQQGLTHLITTLEEDTKALDTVLSGLKGVQLVGVRNALRSA